MTRQVSPHSTTSPQGFLDMRVYAWDPCEWLPVIQPSCRIACLYWLDRWWILWCSHLNNVGLVITKVQLPGALLCVASLRFTVAKKSGWDFHTSHISMDSQESTSFFMAGSWMNHWRDQKCHSPMIYCMFIYFPLFSLFIFSISNSIASWIWQIHTSPWFKKCGILCRGRAPLDRFVMFCSASRRGSLSVSLYICIYRIQVAKNKLIRPSWYYIQYIYIYDLSSTFTKP